MFRRRRRTTRRRVIGGSGATVETTTLGRRRRDVVGGIHWGWEKKWWARHVRQQRSRQIHESLGGSFFSSACSHASRSPTLDQFLSTSRPFANQHRPSQPQLLLPRLVQQFEQRQGRLCLPCLLRLLNLPGARACLCAHPAAAAATLNSLASFFSAVAPSLVFPTDPLSQPLHLDFSPFHVLRSGLKSYSTSWIGFKASLERFQHRRLAVSGGQTLDLAVAWPSTSTSSRSSQSPSHPHDL